MALAGRKRAAQQQRPLRPSVDIDETDGRRARSIRTRAVIVESFLELVRETGAVPTAAQIGRRAGCSTRSVFERFVDFRALAEAAFDHILQSGLSTPVGDVPTRDRQTRIAFHVKIRATKCENWLPLWRVLMRASIGSLEMLKDRIALIRAMSRSRVELMYAPELATLSPSRREATLIALEALTDFESWGRMREHYKLSFEEACEVWRAMTDQMLPATPASAA